LIGFLPLGIWAWKSENPSLLWLALTLFMIIRVIGLGIQVPRTLRENFQTKEA
jgi:MATE family multidrug resistance protein